MAENESGAWYATGKPLDTLEEIDRFNLPRKHAGSCSKPTHNQNGEGYNAGCLQWDKCDHEFKGEGPRCGGCKLLKVGPDGRVLPSRYTVMDCFAHVALDAGLRARDAFNDGSGGPEVGSGMWVWEADEGEPYKFSGTTPVPSKSNPLQVEHVRGETEIVVPKFKRLADRPEMAQYLEFEKAKRAREVREHEKQDARLSGMTGGRKKRGSEPAQPGT